MALYLLFESSNGFGLFERVEAEEIGKNAAAVQEAAQDFGRFGQIMKLKAFYPFETAEAALDAINCLSEGVLPETLSNFLALNMPKAKGGKKAKFSLGVQEPRLGSAIQESLKIPCQSNDLVNELVRGIRLHFERFVKGLEKGDLEAAQRGLAHSYSRSKVKFNVNRVDNMIIQAIALLDQLDKDINTFAMRVREWYSWHFPELVKLVNDNYTYCRLVQLIRHKEQLKDTQQEEIEEITMDAEQARQIIEAAKISMGSDLNEFDMINVERFAKKVVNLANYRKDLYSYLVSKMESCAPSLTAVVGEQVGARLISHAGSLTNLAKYPASTVQILGAEKALFRALKTRSNTPKYGLLYHSSFIGRAGSQNKGRISRFLANKCSLAARIDSFSDVPTSVYGEKLRDQVEERLTFFTTGNPPRKNADVMHEAFEEAKLALSASAAAPSGSKKKGRKQGIKRSREEVDLLEDEEEMEAEEVKEKGAAKKGKKGSAAAAAGGAKKKKKKASAAVSSSSSSSSTPTPTKGKKVKGGKKKVVKKVVKKKSK